MAKKMSRDERYEAFKRQVEWNGWDSIARRRFDELFPEPEPDERSISEALHIGDDKGLRF